MSAELALAIVPICIAAISGCRATRDKLKLMCNCTREIAGLWDKFNIQVHVFEREVETLITEILGRDGRKAASAMLRNLQDARWVKFGPQLEQHLVVPSMLEDYLMSMKKINGCITSLQKKLDHLSVGEGKAQPLRVVKGALCIAFGKDAMLEEIKEFRDWNLVLRDTRKEAAQRRRVDGTENHVAALQVEVAARSEKNVPRYESRPQLFHDVRAARSVSRAFQLFLQYYLKQCCENISHESHYALFFLHKLKPGKASKMPWLLEFGRQDANSFSSVRLPFFVATELRPTSRDGSPDDSEVSVCKYQRTETAVAEVRRGSSSHSSNKKASGSKTMVEVGRDSGTLTPPRENICSILSGMRHESRQQSEEGCQFRYSIGDEDEEEHIFRFTAAPPTLLGQGGKAFHHKVQIASLFHRPAHFVAGLATRIELALILVQSMLTHHSTNAWPSSLDSVIDRLSIFSHVPADKFNDLSSTLRTLHIAVAGDEGPSTSRDEEAERNKAMASELRDGYGVWNAVLFSLGAALLQLALWSPISIQSAEDIKMVRRKASAVNEMGAGFRKAMIKLLMCDFGEGSNLDQPELQKAICRTVVDDLQRELDYLLAYE